MHQYADTPGSEIVATTSVNAPEARLPVQPVAQVPGLTDAEVTIFETGAIVLHPGERHGTPLPEDAAGRAKVRHWLFSEANSVAAAIMPGMISGWPRTG